jgi:hypothetical protein
MEINRNQYFIVGMVLLLIGFQLRNIASFTLNERTTKFLVEKIQRPVNEFEGGSPNYLAAIGPTPLKTVYPPAWLGFAILSVGAVLVLHSLAMKKPGG